jgi:hypothetical protein
VLSVLQTLKFSLRRLFKATESDILAVLVFIVSVSINFLISNSAIHKITFCSYVRLNIEVGHRYFVFFEETSVVMAERPLFCNFGQLISAEIGGLQ